MKLFPPFNEKYIRTTTNGVKETFLHIYGAGIVYPDARYEFSKVRDSYLFEYIVSGKGFIECDDKRCELSEGDCVVSPMGKPIHYGADKEKPYVKLWFSAVGKYPESLFSAFMPKGKGYLVKKVNLYSVFEKVLANLESSEPDSTELLCHSILDIMLAVTGKAEPSESAASSRATQIKEYIDTFVCEEIDVKRIAAHLGISERSAVKAFAAEYGITPVKYVRKARLEKSKSLLLETDKSVSEIAHMLHFCDQSYFSTVFMEEFGVYPSEFRGEFGIRNSEFGIRN